MKYPTSEEVEEKGVCPEGFKFYQDQDLGTAEKKHPEWYLWLANRFPGDWVSLDKIDYCARKVPWAALYYTSNLLSKERLSKCIDIVPLHVYHYARELLSPDLLDKCKKKAKDSTLKKERMVIF